MVAAFKDRHIVSLIHTIHILKVCFTIHIPSQALYAQFYPPLPPNASVPPNYSPATPPSPSKILPVLLGRRPGYGIGGLAEVSMCAFWVSWHPSAHLRHCLSAKGCVWLGLHRVTSSYQTQHCHITGKNNRFSTVHQGCAVRGGRTSSDLTWDRKKGPRIQQVKRKSTFFPALLKQNQPVYMCVRRHTHREGGR